MLDNLYHDIGTKIKNWAKWIFIIEAIGAVISGLCIIGSSVWLGFLCILIGPVVAFISTWILYGFGQLIENSDINTQRIENIEKSLVSQPTTTPNAHVASQKHTWRCTCGNIIDKEICPYCGKVYKPSSVTTQVSGNQDNAHATSNIAIPDSQKTENIWMCPKCNKKNIGSICLNCGTKKNT